MNAIIMHTLCVCIQVRILHQGRVCIWSYTTVHTYVGVSIKLFFYILINTSGHTEVEMEVSLTKASGRGGIIVLILLFFCLFILCDPSFVSVRWFEITTLENRLSMERRQCCKNAETLILKLKDYSK